MTELTETTKEQFKALLRKYDQNDSGYPSFLDFRKAVQPTFGMDGAVVVNWCGMWLCIEEDGYTHT